MDKDFLLAMKFTMICLNPFECFKWDQDSSKATDFHKFYENYENIEVDSLYQEVLNDVKKLK